MDEIRFFFITIFAIAFWLMAFIPGVVAFFSLRHAIFSFIALIVTQVVTTFVSPINGFFCLQREVNLSDGLLTISGMAICYSSSWIAMHFVLPKTLLSNVSRKIRVIVGTTLLVTVSLFFSYMVN